MHDIGDGLPEEGRGECPLRLSLSSQGPAVDVWRMHVKSLKKNFLSEKDLGESEKLYHE